MYISRGCILVGARTLFSYVLLLVCDTKIASVRSVVQSSSSNLLSIRSVPSQIYAIILHSIIFILSNSFVCFILHLDHLTAPFLVFVIFILIPSFVAISDQKCSLLFLFAES